jgi:hypothetical protein
VKLVEEERLALLGWKFLDRPAERVEVLPGDRGVERVWSSATIA